MKFSALCVCLTMATLGGLAIPAAAAAAPPATMSGEGFTASGGPPSVVCLGPGSFSFTASGAATGPYSGTFTETGTGTALGVPTGGSLTVFSASFTIHSASGDVLVRGSKTLSGSGGSFCHDTSGATGGGGVSTTYQATIYTPTGNYSDHGTSQVQLLFTNSSGTTLRERFLSTLGQPVLIAPTNKDQCKHGGWENYPQFKNQGDCVSFVATDGKNPPAN